jgi:hypothetical protein
MIRQELECGCEMLIYQDGSAAPEVAFCSLHANAKATRDVLIEIRDSLGNRARQHECMGYHCSTCSPVDLIEMATDAIRLSGAEE